MYNIVFRICLNRWSHRVHRKHWKHPLPSASFCVLSAFSDSDNSCRSERA